MKKMSIEQRHQYWLDIIQKVDDLVKEGKTIKVACKELGVVRQTYSVWKNRFKKGDLRVGDVRVVEYKADRPQRKQKLELNPAVFTASQVHALLREFVK